MSIVTFLKRRSFETETGFNHQDPTAMLIEQHREVDALFHALETASDRAVKDKLKLVAELEKKLQTHTSLEESVFYPEVKELDKAMIGEAYEEHETIKFELRRLKASAPKDEAFKARVTVLKELIQHHVREEETDLFPKVRLEFPEERLQKLTAKMQSFLDHQSKEPPKRAPAKRVAATRKSKVTVKKTTGKTAAPKKARRTPLAKKPIKGKKAKMRKKK